MSRRERQEHAVAEPLLLWAEDAAPLDGEVVAMVVSEGAPDLLRGPLGALATRQVCLIGPYTRRVAASVVGDLVQHVVVGPIAGELVEVRCFDRFWPEQLVGVLRHTIRTGARAGRSGWC